MGSSNGKKRGRRSFLKTSAAAVGAIGTASAAPGEAAAGDGSSQTATESTRPGARPYNGPYTGEHLNRVAFPLGGMGAGMVCLEGTGALSHVSLRHRPEVFNEPCMFAALNVKAKNNVARVLEGPVPAWKIFGSPGTGNGAAGTSFGLPRFTGASFR